MLICHCYCRYVLDVLDTLPLVRRKRDASSGVIFKRVGGSPDHVAEHSCECLTISDHRLLLESFKRSLVSGFDFRRCPLLKNVLVVASGSERVQTTLEDPFLTL